MWFRSNECVVAGGRWPKACHASARPCRAHRLSRRGSVVTHRTRCSSLPGAMTKILTASWTLASAGAASIDIVRLKCRLASKKARFSAGLYWRVAHQASARTGRLTRWLRNDSGFVKTTTM